MMLRSKIHIKYVIFMACAVVIIIIKNPYYRKNRNWMRALIMPFETRQIQNSLTKNVLIWTSKKQIFYDRAGLIFPRLNCPIDNCYFTDDMDYLNDYTKFDAIIFKEDILAEKEDRPKKRSDSQVYVFLSAESAYNYPACEVINDNFFNWTFTSKLDSDLVWNFFVVRDVHGDLVAPKVSPKWNTREIPLSPKIEEILQKKTKAVAWLVSHCNAENARDEYATRLQENLHRYALQIDVFGDCNHKKCHDDCEEMLARDYYFYLAFENSFAPDYVTEKVLHGYNNYAVPIVFGGANYSRFVPPNSYINAREVHPYNLAYQIYEAMNQYTIYKSFFTWTNHYMIDGYPSGLHPFCHFCKALHSRQVSAPAHEDFRVWWNGLDGMSRCLPEEHWTESLLGVDPVDY